MRRALFLLVLIGEAGCIRTQPTPLARAAEYLWNQQADDGGWHSKTYGLLASGQSLTPFVLDALLQVPREMYPLPDGKVDRSVVFIRRNTRSDGALGLADSGIPDYPNYSTALAVTALCRAQRAGRETQVRAMVAYLRAQQFTETTAGARPTLLTELGAWAASGELRRTPDMSTSR